MKLDEPVAADRSVRVVYDDASRRSPAIKRPSGRTTIGWRSPTSLILSAREPISPSLFLNRFRTLIFLMSNFGIRATELMSGGSIYITRQNGPVEFWPTTLHFWTSLLSI